MGALVSSPYSPGIFPLAFAFACTISQGQGNSRLDAVSACLADRGKGVSYYPFAEKFRFRFAAFPNDIVKAVFVDNRCILLVTKGVGNGCLETTLSYKPSLNVTSSLVTGFCMKVFSNLTFFDNSKLENYHNNCSTFLIYN